MINLKNLIVIFTTLLLLLIPQTFAAEITGYVYDYSLEVVNDVVLTIDTNPKQQMISKDGSYSFIIGVGEYTLTAKYQKNNRVKYQTEEKITITDDGKYNLDIILFPFLDEDYELSDDIELDVDEITENDKIKFWFILPISIILISIFLIIYWFFMRKKSQKKIKTHTQKKLKPKSNLGTKFEEISQEKQKVKPEKIIEPNLDLEPDELYSTILNLIKENKRITQKEIRKQVPYSEAKVSLVITELVDKGIVKKIKKGRGNIIVLK